MEDDCVKSLHCDRKSLKKERLKELTDRNYIMAENPYLLL